MLECVNMLDNPRLYFHFPIPYSSFLRTKSALRLDQASSTALSEDSFFDCLENVMTQSKVIACNICNCGSNSLLLVCLVYLH